MGCSVMLLSRCVRTTLTGQHFGAGLLMVVVRPPASWSTAGSTGFNLLDERPGLRRCSLLCCTETSERSSERPGNARQQMLER